MADSRVSKMLNIEFISMISKTFFTAGLVPASLNSTSFSLQTRRAATMILSPADDTKSTEERSKTNMGDLPF